MARRTTVGIKNLKNNLSAYLRDVRAGARVFVSDRGKIVAELHEPGVTYDAAEHGNPILAAWARAGVVTLPRRPKTPLPKSPVRLPKGTAARILDAERMDKAR